MSEVERMSVAGAPAPKGAYAQVVRAGDFLFVSGQGPIDPASQELVPGEIRAQTKLTLENIERILAGCGASKRNIVKCGVFLTSAADFSAMNEAYAAFFDGAMPARTTVQAALVAPGMKVEIDCVAYFPKRN